MEQDDLDIDRLLDELVEREGGFVDHPADRGGATRFGITEAVARAHGFRGAMRYLPRDEALSIYRRLYWLRPRFDAVAERSARIAAELFDTGVNMGPAVAATFLQRALTALNRQGKDFADLVPDGRVGPRTLDALDGFLAARGTRGGRSRAAPRARSLAGRTLPSPGRAPPRQRSLSLRLAGEPDRIDVTRS